MYIIYIIYIHIICIYIYIQCVISIFIILLRRFNSILCHKNRFSSKKLRHSCTSNSLARLRTSSEAVARPSACTQKVDGSMGGVIVFKLLYINIVIIIVIVIIMVITNNNKYTYYISKIIYTHFV